jgi:hypothetical protein
MVLNLNSAEALTWVVAHEFGHIIGLRDRYSESIMSRARGSFGGQRTNTVEAGYEGNLMGVHQGKLESRNVRDLVAETAPGMLDDDNQVRDWISRHSRPELGALSANIKIRMITTLMGGWISDDDVSAMQQICRSVTDSGEARAIRGAITPRLIDMTSLGQRTQMRVALSQMP